KVDANDLIASGSVLGTTDSADSLVAAGTSLDLTGTTLSSIEVLATTKGLTTFKVDKLDLADQGTVIGSTGSDTLQVFDTDANLTSTTLNSVEVLKAGSTNNTTFTVDTGDLASGGSVIGNAVSGTNGIDTLTVNGAAADLRSTTLSNIDV